MIKEPTPIDQVLTEIDNLDSTVEAKKVLKLLLLAELDHPDSKTWWYTDEYERIIGSVL